MPFRRKSTERKKELIARGKKGPSNRSIKRRFTALRKSSNNYAKSLVRIHTTQNKMAIRSALDAAGLDPRKPEGKRIRRKVYDNIGRAAITEVVMQARGEFLLDGAYQTAAGKVNKAYDESLELIRKKEGNQAAKRFEHAFSTHEKRIINIIQGIWK